MPPKKIFLFLSALSCLLPFFPSSLAAQSQPNQGVFTSVSGEVSVTHARKSATALKDSTITEGDDVLTGKNSTATLRFFDGSELSVKPETKFTIGKLQKGAGEDKILQFKLAIGKLFATVKKLASSKSSFEIEAGGVVCGVRGTEYEVDFDPDKDKVDIFVTDGNVWAKSGGETFQYGPGGEGHFTDGKPNSEDGNQGQGNKGKGTPAAQPPGPPNNFSPFYGLNGNQTDPFQPLTGATTDTHSIAGKTGDDNLLGLGAHTVILQFKYPEQ
jgi:hypothetical protein